MAQAKNIAQPFLNEQFPEWRHGNDTYMIPPIFKPKQTSEQTGIMQSTTYTGQNTGYTYLSDIGESKIYSRLKELRNVSMFVVHGFELKGMPNWNSKTCKKDKAREECDFIIFHNRLGILLIEVKSHLTISDSIIEQAENQLNTEREVIMTFANPTKVTLSNKATQNTDYASKSAESKATDDLTIPYKKVIALPSTKKTSFNRDDYASLNKDTLLIFEEDSLNISSFRRWWYEAIKSQAAIQMSEESQEEYERALSFILMIRHMSPATETEHIGKIQESIRKYRENESKAYAQVMEDMFPFFWSCCWNVVNQMNKKDLPTDEEILHLNKESEENSHTGPYEEAKYNYEVKHSLVHDSTSGELKYSPCLVFEKILNYFRRIQNLSRKIEQHPKEKVQEFSFLNLESSKDLAMLYEHLSGDDFVEGKKPSKVDIQLFKSLTCRIRLEYARHPIVMTAQQLVVFQGPSKQLIIGPPGSGKTELMKFKALELESEMKICKRRKKKIMYILANGNPKYPDRNSLFFYHMKEFFKRSSFVEVITIVMENESAQDTKDTTSVIRKKIASGEYDHAFIDECWIGSEPGEHEILTELVHGLPGYVWISSVFSFRRDEIKYDEKVAVRTQPLLTALKENGGNVSYINQVKRATNNIIELERAYGGLKQNTAYPYGTEKILGHSYKGPPVTWAAEKNIGEMYDKCVHIVNSSVHSQRSIKSQLIFNPADILVVDFAIRIEASRQLEQSLLDRLKNGGIPVWTFDESTTEQTEQLMRCKMKNVTLLQAKTRDVSEFIDGVEWPMVVVILPSEMVRKEAKLAKDASKLRSYDPYISFFRSMVKLVVISDKWTNMQEFLDDVKFGQAKSR